MSPKDTQFFLGSFFFLVVLIVLYIALITQNDLIKQKSETFMASIKNNTASETKGSIGKSFSSIFDIIMSTSTDSVDTAALIASTTLATTTDSTDTKKKPVYSYDTYIEVIDGCGVYQDGLCAIVRSGPGTEYTKIASMRNGMVLRVSKVVTAKDGGVWYKVTFSDEWIRYPERKKGDWYISEKVVKVLPDTESSYTDDAPPKTNKKIIIDRGDQMLYAYEGEELFMGQVISTGKQGHDTPRGTFQIFRKTPSRYMQGPLPGISSQVYDLPGVPWTMYFTVQGGAIHGTYWHDKFGEEWSHGCVNMQLGDAEELYKWADLGTTVVVRD
ncbi:MAG: hypothetical protein RI996_429 [Candidatus Parcubacteria bacterium]|jgi:hypothetical protein